MIKQNKKPESTLREFYEAKKGSYKELKESLIEDLESLITPMRERREEWKSKPEEVERIMSEGGHKIRKIIHEKMIEVRERVGLIHHD